MPFQKANPPPFADGYETVQKEKCFEFYLNKVHGIGDV